MLPPSLIFFFLNGLLCGKFVFLRTFHLISTTTTFECNVESSEMAMQEVLIMKMTPSNDANIYSCVDGVGLFCIYPICDAGFRRPPIWGRGRAPNSGPRTPIFFHILIFYRDYCTIALKSTNPPNENGSDPPPASNRVKSNIHELQNHDHEDAVVIWLILIDRFVLSHSILVNVTALWRGLTSSTQVVQSKDHDHPAVS